MTWRGLPCRAVVGGDDPDWVVLRQGFLGSSDSPTIILAEVDLDEDRFEVEHISWKGGTPLQVYASKVADPDELRVEEAKIRSDFTDVRTLGHLHEPTIATLFERTYNRDHAETLKVVPCQVLLQSEVYPWLSATPDFLVFIVQDDGTEVLWGVLETKWKRNFDAATALRKSGLFVDWFIQVQHQLIVTGLDSCAVAWLCGGSSFDYVFVDADPEIQAMIVEVTRDFWELHVQGLEPPWPRYNRWSVDSYVLSKLFPGREDLNGVRLPQESLHWDKVYAEYGRRISDKARELKELKERRDKVGLYFRTAMRDHETAFLPDAVEPAYATRYTLKRGEKNVKRTLKRHAPE